MLRKYSPVTFPRMQNAISFRVQKEEKTSKMKLEAVKSVSRECKGNCTETRASVVNKL